MRSEYQVTHSFSRNSIVLLMTHPINTFPTASCLFNVTAWERKSDTVSRYLHVNYLIILSEIILHTLQNYFVTSLYSAVL